MKAVCIIGSPNDQGNTAYFVDKIIAGMTAKKVAVKRYVLGLMSIKYCLGCKTCYETGQCVQHDDMDLIIGDLMEADIVLIASPSYWGDVSGQLKVFIDRCLPLCNARTGETPIPPGKAGIAVAIRAGQRPEENQHIIDTIAHNFGHLGIDLQGTLMVEGVETVHDLARKTHEMEEAYQLGENIHTLAVKSRGIS